MAAAGSLFQRFYSFFFHFHVCMYGVHVCVCVHVHVCMFCLPECAYSCMWRSGLHDRNHPQLPIFLIHRGRVSHSSPELTYVASLANQFTLRIPCLCLRAWNYRQAAQPHVVGVDLN